MPKNNRKIKDTLSIFDIKWNKPYYVSAGLPLPNLSKTPVRIDYFAFIVCTQGHIKVKVEENYVSLKKNDILLTNPPTFLKLREQSLDLEVKFLLFEKNFLLKHMADTFLLDKLLCSYNGQKHILTASQKEVKKILNLLDYISDKIESQSKYYEEIIRTSIFLLLLETVETLSTKEKNHNANKTPNLYYKFLDLVKENVAEHRDVQFYLDNLHITNRNLILSVKKGSGQTPHQIIGDALIKEAIIMMNNPDINISDIAFALNFNSVAAFSRFFKKITNNTPSDYRNNNA